MPTLTRAWTDDLSTLSSAEVATLETENRGWGRELRHGMTALLNRRLAKQITVEEYAATRQSVKDEMAECKRRAMVLFEAINDRHRGD